MPSNALESRESLKKKKEIEENPSVYIAKKLRNWSMEVAK